MGMKEAIDELNRRRAHALAMGGPGKVARRQALGQESARQRVESCSIRSFFEIGMLNHSDVPGMEERPLQTEKSAASELSTVEP